MNLGLVRVSWTDAWFELDDSGNRPDDFRVETVGWLIEDGGDWVRVAGEMTPQGPRAVSHIPRPCVWEVESL